MTDVDNHSVYEDDDTLSKLQTALADADGHKVKHNIEAAVEDRKKQLRQNVYAHGEK